MFLYIWNDIKKNAVKILKDVQFTGNEVMGIAMLLLMAGILGIAFMLYKAIN
ncbi:hypothetical protein GIX45_02245 [Erwinia sp. CPCC 100877]|nr:hypothetical protein [Erwinia sp. CPCC 100877]